MPKDHENSHDDRNIDDANKFDRNQTTLNTKARLQKKKKHFAAQYKLNVNYFASLPKS